jgi:hypothetical protein
MIVGREEEVNRLINEWTGQRHERNDLDNLVNARTYDDRLARSLVSSIVKDQFQAASKAARLALIVSLAHGAWEADKLIELMEHCEQ